MKNKQVKQMMESVFDGKWERLEGGSIALIILEGYFGSWPVYCRLHKLASLTANQLKKDKA